jgi:single-strand DNA-binding protein
MQQLNKIELKGIVGNIRIQEFDGNRMARIGLATCYGYRDRDGAAVIDTSWHSVVAWEGRNIKDLDKIAKHTKLHVIGRIRYQSYTGMDGVDRISTDIVASRVEIIQDESPLSFETSDDEDKL